MLNASSIYDDLAVITSNLDQVEALLFENRMLFPFDSHFQLELDRKQAEIDAKRARIKTMTEIADYVYKK